jgi:hypothetical protein
MISNIFEKSSKKFELCPAGVTNKKASLLGGFFSLVF